MLDKEEEYVLAYCDICDEEFWCTDGDLICADCRRFTKREEQANRVKRMKIEREDNKKRNKPKRVDKYTAVE